METDALDRELDRPILLVEYFVGGGLPNLTSSLILEGYAMLKAAAEALTEAGFKLIVAVDRRVEPFLKLPRLRRIKAGPGGLLKTLKKEASASYALLIAPPMDGAHANLTSLMEELGIEVLGPSTNKLIKVLDKAELARSLNALGVRYPKTIELDPIIEESVHEAGEKLGYPLVIKPVDGAGCEGLMIVGSSRQIKEAVKEAKTYARRYIAQEMVKGVHASVSLIADGRRAKALALNAQQLLWKKLPSHPSYEGGYTPLIHRSSDEALKEAEKVVEYFGLKGYVGIDLVLSDEGPFIVEVNPRLTTSFIALTSTISPSHLGRCLVNVTLGRLDPSQAPFMTRHVCALRKLKTPIDLTLTPLLIERLSSTPGVYVTTPLTGRVPRGESIALLKAEASNLRSAVARLGGITRKVESIIKAKEFS